MYKFYILEVDLFVPNDLQFIPISLKIPGEVGCFYMYGEHKNQHFCDVDLAEAERVGIQIKYVHQGIGFTEHIDNFLSQYITEMCDRRSEVKDVNPVLSNTYKLMANGAFGKTAVKDNTDSYAFTSLDRFKKLYANKDLIDYEYYPGNHPRVLARFAPNQDRADTFKKATKKQKLVHVPYPSIVGVYILAHSRRVMNNFIHAIDGFKQPKVYYSDTDSLFIEQDSLNKLKQLGYYGKNFGQGKNDLSKQVVLSCEEYKKIGFTCTHNPEVAHTHKYNTDPVITEAYFLGPKQKWINTFDKVLNRSFTSLTLKGIPNRVSEKHIVHNADGTMTTSLEHIQIEKKFTLEQVKELIQAQRDGNDKKKYKIDFAARLT